VIIDVHMRDGQTTFQLSRRSDLSELLNREADNDTKPLRAKVRWSPQAVEWAPIDLTYMNRHQIGFVVRGEVPS
jgi:hypothetical protein